MDGTSLRFKITGAELEELLAGRPVVNRPVVGGVSVVVVIEPRPHLSTGLSAQCLAEKGAVTLQLAVAAEKLTQLKDMGKSRDGIAVTEGDTVLYLLVDARKTSAEQ
ncbi:MAG: hypothetical protein EP349_02030 [Alphaproteobacteria bacterium]|nr:MAG: hypothetical protein EP349_02030 [Alphaproteobacteria bacterium]